MGQGGRERKREKESERNVPSGRTEKETRVGTAQRAISHGSVPVDTRLFAVAAQELFPSVVGRHIKGESCH